MTLGCSFTLPKGLAAANPPDSARFVQRHIVCTKKWQSITTTEPGDKWDRVEITDSCQEWRNVQIDLGGLQDMTRQREANWSRRSMAGLKQVPRILGEQYAIGWTDSSLDTDRAQEIVPGSRIRTVMVPLDGSYTAQLALPQALAIARRSGAALRLVHVHSLAGSGIGWQQLSDEALMADLRQRKQDYLQSVLRRLKRQVDVQIDTAVIDSHDIAPSLCAAAAGADLVVIATEPRGILGRLLRGSVTESLARTLPCPLLRVGSSGVTLDLAADPMPRHILIPLDGTTFGEGIFDAAAALGSLSSARITLAHLQHVGETQLWPDRSGAYRYLREAAKRFEQRVPYVDTQVVISNRRTAPEILSLIKEEGIDMVAMATRGRLGLARLAKGSVAASVIRRAKASVLVVCPSAAKAETQERRRAH